ncbi:hypothetical protein QYS48_29805 [Marivirga arenosa]|uniref:Uncharacterized protein n=1 Tax=Marivirga arenosa TaxID=3059076 RepID=A0AA51R9L9_9BACT|nr:hypothetical protein [Marivirga sp. ABR2-2]WMN07761.1 hypothetical protein QYS48_29805 [Marivirga sp. ABR2-2]
MSEEHKNQQTSNNSDEIDLRELFSAIGNFFKNIFLGFIMLIVKFRNATLKHIKIIIVFGLLGGFVGIALNYYLPDYYSSYMLINSKHSSGRLMENSVDKLQQLSSEGNYIQLAKILDIDTVQAKNLKGFRYEPFVSEEEIVELEVLKEQLKGSIDDEETINRFVEKLKIDNKSTYKIFVEVFNNDGLAELEQPLVNYFRENEYVSKRLEIEKENLKDRAQNLREELARLDSLKKILMNSYSNLFSDKAKSGSNNVILGDEKVDPISIFEESKIQYRELQRIEEDIYLMPSFELIDGFTVFSKPESPSLIKLGFYSGLVGLGIAYIIIMLISFNKYLNKVEEDNKRQAA